MRQDRQTYDEIFIVLRLALLTFFVLLAFPQPAKAQFDVTGNWFGYYDVGAGQVQVTFSLEQEGSVITGLVPGGGSQGDILGSISGSSLTFRIGFNDISYSLDITAQTNGSVIVGDLVDSNSQTGGFAAAKITSPGVAQPLTPITQITIPPTVNVKDDDATITLQKYKKPTFKRVRKTKAAASTVPKAAVRYEVTLKGAERRKIISERNRVTVKNLKPGNYQVTYRAIALKNGKPAFSTRPSPAASFTIDR